MVCAWYLGHGQPVPPSLRKFYFIEASHQAARKYAPRLYPGRVVLFLSEGHTLDRERRWGALAAGGIETHVVQSDHFGLLSEAHIDAIAERVAAHFYAVRPAAARPTATEMSSPECAAVAEAGNGRVDGDV
jgi:hypothetical protein